MSQPAKPVSRLSPLPVNHVPELTEVFSKQQASGHFVPNSLLIMQRRPKLVTAIRQLSAAVFDPAGEVTLGFKRLLAYVVARTHGCHY